MPDPDRIDNVSGASGARVRALLWVVLVISAAGNAVSSLGELGTLISLGFGIVTVLCIVLLIVSHLRGRRQ